MVDQFSFDALAPGSVFLDSSLQAGSHFRYSVMGTKPFLVIEGKGNSLKTISSKGISFINGSPLSCLEKLLDQYKLPQQSAFFGPGAFGYLSYELGYQIQNISCLPKDDLHLPDVWLAFYDEVLIYDHVEKKLQRCAMEKQEKVPLHLLEEWEQSRQEFPRASFTRNEYEKAFWRAMEHIRRGDIYQANLCQRFSVPFDASPWEAYLGLRKAHPTSLSAFLNTGRNFVLSCSPELFLKKEGKRIETCPIKGTRARPLQAGRPPDSLVQEELRKSEKDLAEHIMIVDLERNDLGRICEIGSIMPEDLLSVESCGSVYHLVSTVSGKVPEKTGIAQILGGTFPGGSITGAPKQSAMKIIGRLEPCARGVYTGALGWFGFSGDFILNLPIRTLLVQDQFAHFYVGGGIVADSTPDGEYQEALDKGSAFFKILGIDHAAEAIPT